MPATAEREVTTRKQPIINPAKDNAIPPIAQVSADDANDAVPAARSGAKGNALDLSSDEDLGIGIMNLISIEEHLFMESLVEKGGVPAHVKSHVEHYNKTVDAALNCCKE